ncbi:MAG: biotin--[acetyl-CoA-carboxylase] ligase [Gemmatimonadota bacterium]
MAVYTDAPDYAETLTEATPDLTVGGAPTAVRPVLDTLLGERAVVASTPLEDPFWDHLVVSRNAPDSQYARLVGLLRSGTLVPDRLACVARTGGAFQGFNGRTWSGGVGNLHLTVHLAPRQPIERFETVFLALAAVAVIEALDGIPGLSGRCQIKWVNDLLIDGAKVGGVLAHTQTRGAAVTSVVLGIGVNVTTAPAVAPTAFVPAITCLREHATAPAALTTGRVMRAVLGALGGAYEALLVEGYRPLLDRYRARSSVLGREVLVSEDRADEATRVLAAGRVTAIGDGLELRLEGHADPVRRGRAILHACTRAGARTRMQYAS